MTDLALLAPTAAFALVWWLETAHRQVLGLGRLSWRGTFVVAFISFQALLVLMTELLSVGNHLTTRTTLLGWLLIDGVLGGVVMATVEKPVDLAGHARRLGDWFRGRSDALILGCLALVGILVALGVTAVLYDTPTNGDSLVYHLPRVAQWVQQASVDHFTTHYLAQIELAPLHEFNMLHVHLLAGHDRLDGFVQLAAYVVCVFGAAEIARVLGGSAAVQVGAAMIFAVTPSAVLEATSTQNNVFTAAIGTGLLVLLFAWIPLGRWSILSVLLGAAVGLAVLAKGTLVPLIGPAVLFLAGRIVMLEKRESSWRQIGRRTSATLLVIAVCSFALAGPFLKRNYDLFGSFVGPVSETTINAEFSERAIVANAVRSTASNFHIGGSGPGIDTALQEVALGGLREVYELTDVAPDDRRYLLGPEFDAFGETDYTGSAKVEERGANPWHVLLLVATGLYLLVAVARGHRWARLPLLLAAGLSVGFFAFSGSARWSVYVTRYQLPLFVAWAPIIALTAWRIRRALLVVVTAALLLAARPQLFDNNARSLIDHESTSGPDLYDYFYYPDGIDGALVGAADYVETRDAIVESGCDRVGIANWVLLEYPIWAGLDEDEWDGEIQHVNVTNESQELADSEFVPCALISQALGRSPREAPPGWNEHDFGELVVSVAPGY